MNGPRRAISVLAALGMLLSAGHKQAFAHMPGGGMVGATASDSARLTLGGAVERALARGAGERVVLIIGAAHRPFTEADLRAQPWIEVQPANRLLGAD